MTPNADLTEFAITGEGVLEPLLRQARSTPKEVVTPASPDRFRLTVPLRTVYRRAA